MDAPTHVNHDKLLEFFTAAVHAKVGPVATVQLDLGRADGTITPFSKPHNGTGVVEIKTSEPPQGWPEVITVNIPENLSMYGLTTRLVRGKRAREIRAEEGCAGGEAALARKVRKGNADPAKGKEATHAAGKEAAPPSPAHAANTSEDEATEASGGVVGHRF